MHAIEYKQPIDCLYLLWYTALNVWIGHYKWPEWLMLCTKNIDIEPKASSESRYNQIRSSRSP